MLIFLILLMAIDAMLHAWLVLRFGVAGGNAPFAIFAVVYVVLAVIVFLAVPYALWITLVVVAIGLIGLTVTFNTPQRDKSLDRIIWGLDAAVLLVTAYMLFFAGSPPPAA